jgi:hypothetical protein
MVARAAEEIARLRVSMVFDLLNQAGGTCGRNRLAAEEKAGRAGEGTAKHCLCAGFRATV